MKLGKTLLFGGLIVAGGYFLYNQFSSRIGINFSGIKFKGRDGLKLRFAILYKLTNANDTSATVSNLNGRINYGEMELGRINVDQPVTITAGGTHVMEVIFSVLPGRLLGEIEEFITNKGGFKKFRIVATMTGKVGQIPFVAPIAQNIELAA